MSARRRELRIGGTTAILVALGGGLVFLLLGLYLGARVFLSRGGGPWVEILPTTFGVWETRPPGEHLFLAFLRPADVAAGRPYAHYSQPLLLLEYVWLQPLRWLGISYSRAQIALCLPQLALLLGLLAAHLRDLPPFTLRPVKPLPLLRLAVLTLAVAGVVTLPAFWVPFFRFNPEHYFFLPALAFCYLAGADYRGTLRGRDAALTLVPIALLAPLFTPFLVASWFIVWGMGAAEDEPVRRRTAARLAAIAALGVLVFLLPSLAARLGGLPVGGSGFTFRSGLDGSQVYFTSMLQALWAPSDSAGRAWQVWQWPAAALSAIAAAGVWAPAAAARMARQLFLCWVPLLWTVIVFPQLVSIHPYYLDFHLTLGAAFCLAFWLQRRELGGWIEAPALRLAVVMAVAALLMTNLIDLARLRTVIE